MNEIIIIAVLILLNGFLAMSEIALISVRKSHLESELKNGKRSARIALRLADNPDRFLSTIQIGITIIGILTGIYSGSVLAEGFSQVLIGWGVAVSIAYVLAQTLIVIAVTYFTLIFGELVPKRIGMSTAGKVSVFVARPMYLLYLLTAPFVWLLAKSTHFVFNLLGFETNSNKVTEEEIRFMVKEGAKDGEVQEVEQDIVDRVFLLGDLKVSSLMTHRSDLIALDIHMKNEQIKEVLRNNLHEMYPVIDRSFDCVKGVITLKNLLFTYDRADFDLSSELTPAVYFHEHMSVYKALEKMKEARISQALICDEFGSCQGIITLKDILEGLVGTIEDTYTDPDIIKRKDSEGWLVDGQCALYDFLNYFDKEDLYKGNNNYNTLGGLILEHLEHIPQSGEVMQWSGFRFEVVDMDGARIDKVLVTLYRADGLSDEIGE